MQELLQDTKHYRTASMEMQSTDSSDEGEEEGMTVFVSCGMLANRLSVNRIYRMLVPHFQNLEPCEEFHAKT